MSKFILITATLLILSIINPKTSFAAGNINLFWGDKELKTSDWAPVEDQGELGLQLDFKSADWPVSIAIDSLTSYTEETIAFFDIEGETTEFNIGIKKLFNANPPITPFIGGGISFIDASLKVTDTLFGGSATVSGSGTGYWVTAGAFATIGDSFNVGLELKISTATVDILGLDAEGGGSHFGLLFGYHWD